MPTERFVQSPLMIGRDAALSLVGRRIGEARDGHGGLLLLSGEAGIGKSRLMGAALREARLARCRVAKGDLAPQDALVPLASIRDLARSLDPGEFDSLGPDLLEMSSDAGEVRVGPRRFIVHGLADRIIDGLERPTVLGFDDLQWADELTLEVVAELAHLAGERPLLLLGAYRRDELPVASVHREWRSRLITQRLAEEIRLERLGATETGLVTTLILGGGLPAPREVAEAVHERTNGIPLHIEELLAVVGDAVRIDARAIRDASVPDTIEDAVLAHVARLSDDARAAARAGAVLGRCFAPEVLAGVMDRPVATLDAPLQELVDNAVLHPFEFVDRGYFDFRHQLLRDTLYASLPPSESRRLHARAAEYGAHLVGANDVHASVHYERAGLATLAFRSALRGARSAARLSSHRESFDLYRRVLSTIPSEVPTVERAAILEEFAIEALAIEDADASVRAIDEAHGLYRTAGDAVAATGLLPERIGAARREGRPLAERQDMIRSAIEEAAALGDGDRVRAIRARIAVEDGLACADALDLAGAEAAFLRAEGLAGAVDDAELHLAIASDRSMLGALRGSIEGLEKLAEVARDARDAGFMDPALTAYRDASVIAARAFEPRRARVLLEEGLRYADSIQQSFCAHVMTSTLALVDWSEGHWDDAAAGGRQALADRGWARPREMARWPLAYAALGRGDVDDARGHLQPALAFGERSGIVDFILAALWGLAETALITEEPAHAVEICHRAAVLAEEVGERARFVPFVVTGTRASLAAKRPADARRWLARCSEHLGDLHAYAECAVDHATGLVAVAEGALVAGRRSLERAVLGWDERGRSWEGLWARLDLAACLIRSNRHLDARALLADVKVRATALDSRPLLDRIRELERSARGRGADEEAWHPLTTREFEVARHIAEGLTNSEIATEIAVSPKTVSAHVEHILAKLGVSRRAEVAAWVATVARPTASATSRSETRALAAS